MGICFFAMLVGLEPEVRVWPNRLCAAGGGYSRVDWSAAVGVQRSRLVGKAHTGHRKPDTGTK